VETRLHSRAVDCEARSNPFIARTNSHLRWPGHCPDSAPRGEPEIGWRATDDGGLLCQDRLLIAKHATHQCPARKDLRVAYGVGRADAAATT